MNKYCDAPILRGKVDVDALEFVGLFDGYIVVSETEFGFIWRVPVRSGAWLDVMNSCFYTCAGHVKNYDICVDLSGDIFALEHLDY